jgi:hypothetical protein
MSRPWRFAIAAAQAVFVLALSVGVYVQVIGLTAAVPRARGLEFAATAPTDPSAREHRVPAPVAVAPEPAGPVVSVPPAGGVFGVPPEFVAQPASGSVLYGAPLSQKLFVVASTRRLLPSATKRAASLVMAGASAAMDKDVVGHGDPATTASFKVRTDVSLSANPSRQGPKQPKQRGS